MSSSRPVVTAAKLRRLSRKPASEWRGNEIAEVAAMAVKSGCPVFEMLMKYGAEHLASSTPQVIILNAARIYQEKYQ